MTTSIRTLVASVLAISALATPALATPALATPVTATPVTATGGTATGGTAAGGMPHGIREGDRATMALNALESKGYVAFTHFRADGRNFTADVTKGGKTIHVIVAPRTGIVSVQS